MQYRNNHNWKPVPFTAEERAEKERYEAEQAEEAARYYDEQEQSRAALHPAFQATAAHIVKQANAEIGIGAPIDFAVTNEQCAAFVLEQVEKAGKRLPEGAAKQELRGIYKDIRARGGDAYAEHKARLQQLAK